MPKGDKLTDKQQTFIGHYADPNSPTYNNGTQSALLAGYSPKGVETRASQLLLNIKVKTEIDQIRALLKLKSVKTRTERQLFWSKVADDDSVSMPDRLRASELLGRSEADFTDNIANTVPDQTQTLTPAQQVEQLQSQIKLLTDSEGAGTAIAV